MTTSNITSQAWRHERMMEAVFEVFDWAQLLDCLAVRDTDLHDRLRAAADRLRDADRAAAAAIEQTRPAEQRLTDSYKRYLAGFTRNPMQLHHLGYYSPVVTIPLGLDAHQALTEWNEARSAASALLFDARRVTTAAS